MRLRGGGGGFPIAGKQDGEGAGDVCAMAAHWSTFGALHRWRGRTGATCGGLQVREGGERGEETKPPLGLERFLSFLSFPPARSSRSRRGFEPRGPRITRLKVRERGLGWGDSKLFFFLFRLPCFGLELILLRGLIDEGYGLLIDKRLVGWSFWMFFWWFFFNWNWNFEIY